MSHGPATGYGSADMRDDTDERDAPTDGAAPDMAPDMVPGRRSRASKAAADSAGGLRQLRFLTAGFDEDDARQAYLDRLDGILDTIFLAPFAAEIDAYRLGPLSVLRATATPRQSARLPARIAHDRYDAIGVQYVVAGRATGEANGRPFASDPGSVMLLDYDQPFVVTDQDVRVVVNVAVPRPLFPNRRADPATWHGRVLAGGPAAPLVGFLRQLHHTLDAMPCDAGPLLATAFAQLLAVALGDYDQAGTTAIDRDARIVERAERLVDDRIGSADLDPAWLTAKLGVSRSDLYTAMVGFGGVARFILHRRLTAAHAALESPTDTRRIGAIAYAFGFSSEAYFSRAFRAAFGTTPSDVRRRGR